MLVLSRQNETMRIGDVETVVDICDKVRLGISPATYSSASKDV